LRFDQFDLKYDKKFEKIPKVINFINGFKINPDEDPFCLIVYYFSDLFKAKLDSENIKDDGFVLKATTRNASKVRYLTVGTIISDDPSIILEKGGVDEE
jgi:hypothetical protein